MGAKSVGRLAGLALLLGLALAVFVVRERRAALRGRPLWPAGEPPGRLALQGPGGEESRLERNAAGWRLRAPFDLPADGRALEELCARLAAAEVSELVSADPARRSLFELEPSSAARLRAWRLASDAEPALDVLIGRRSPEGRSYLRRPGSDEVRAVAGLGREELSRGPGEWADRTFCSVSDSELQGLTITRGSAGFTLDRVGEGWRVEGSAEPLSRDALREGLSPLLAALARWEAARVLPESRVDPLALRGLAHPEFILTLRRAPVGAPSSVKTVLVLSVGPKAPDFVRYARRSDVPGFVYVLQDWQAKPFLLERGDLLR